MPSFPIVGGLTFPDKGACSQYITLTTTDPASIPSALGTAYPNSYSNGTFTRLTPAMALSMPKLISLTNDPKNFSSDKRTRVKLFVTNFESSTAGVGSDTVVYAENSVLGTHSLLIEHVARVPNFDWLTEITVILPDGLVNAGDVWVRVVLRGVSSNQARISIREPARALTIPLTQMTPLVNSWIAPNRRLR